MACERAVAHWDWSDIYVLGIATIDQQHKAMFDMIADLCRSIAQDRPKAAVTAALARFEHFSIGHFTNEESLMRRIIYPRYEAHRRSHLEFIRRVAAVRETQAIDDELAHFLGDWLAEHILTADRGYADHYHRLQVQENRLAGATAP